VGTGEWPCDRALRADRTAARVLAGCATRDGGKMHEQGEGDLALWAN